MVIYSVALLLIIGLLAILICLSHVWRIRLVAGYILLVSMTFAIILVVIFGFNRLWVWALLFASLYSLFNLLRIVRSKIQIEHLRRICLKTASRLLLLQVLVVLIAVILTWTPFIHKSRWMLLALIQLALAVLLLSSTSRHKRVAKRIQLAAEVIDKDAPTLTVAIPARDETESLNQCLRSVLDCNYPKLEVLVLDDQSTTRRTPEIIRSFAHDGVEFVTGKPAPKNWVAKNWAYQQLLEVSNGEIILFCGADTRFDTEALRFLVTALVDRKKSMISIMPKNLAFNPYGWRFIQPLRYAWEISLPRRLVNRPPILSTCWVAKREFLMKSGGLKAVTRRIVPESYFAKFATEQDGYSFFMYDGVMSDKQSDEQVETAIRIRYPQLHRQPELAALLSMGEIIALLGSLPLFIMGLVELYVPVIILSGLSIVTMIYMFAMISNMAYRRRLVLNGLMWPVAIVIDLWLVNLSMWRYEFGNVLWKGRSVNPSVMNHRE